MATPIGHALAGYAAYYLNAGIQPERRRTLFWWCLGMAIAPDLDFIPGILQGQPNLYHQGISHSVGMAFAASLIVAIVFFRKRSSWTAWRFLFLAYLSHLAIDFFGPDGRPPYGQPLFWPLSDEYYLAPVPVFWGVTHAKTVSATSGEWITAVMNIRNLVAIVVEVVVLAPLVLLVRYRHNRRGRAWEQEGTEESNDRLPRQLLR